MAEELKWNNTVGPRAAVLMAESLAHSDCGACTLHGHGARESSDGGTKIEVTKTVRPNEVHKIEVYGTTLGISS